MKIADLTNEQQIKYYQDDIKIKKKLLHKASSEASIQFRDVLHQK